MRTLSPSRSHAAAGALLVLLGAWGCAADATAPGAARGAVATADATADAAGDAPGVHRQYGAPVRVGEGRARTYVVLDRKAGGTPVEIGVALDERALDGLPAAMPPGEHGHQMDMHEYLLPLPAQNPTPYRLVELDWNPAGHGAPYEAPHLDVHFYTIGLAERNAIDPADPQFQQKAANLPTGAYVPQPSLVVPPPPAPVLAVPRMGVHWADPRSPELQGMAGHPEAYRPFTTTFMYGSYDGRFVFTEPMMTRDFLLARRAAATAAARDTVMPIATAQRYAPAGWYPAAYRVTWDGQAREYRIALTQLAWRD